MSVGLNTGGAQAFGMQGSYKPNVASTAKLRDFLLGKNLQSSYLSDSNPIPAPFGLQQPGKQNTNIYEQSVIDQKTVQELAPKNLVNLFLDNSYGPEGGYLDVQTINVKKILPRRGLDYVTQNTLQPKSFVSSEYTSAEIFKTVNITNGMVNTLNSKILNDSELVQKSSGNLRKQLGYNQGWNDLDLSDKGSFMFNVSVNPGKKELDGTDYLSRITNLYYGYSNIPGNYFNGIFKPDINFLSKNGISTMAGTFGNIQATVNAVASLLTGGDNVPTNTVSNPVPSDRFITYMGEEQQKALFTSLDFNKYRPDYSRVQLRQGVTNVTPYYYIGSKSNEPSKIQSPMGAIPQDEFGRPINALVYGPSTLAKQLETVNGQQLWPYYMFGLRGYTYNDGGSLTGGWTWMGNQSFASTNAPYDLLSTRSFQKPLRKGGILDQTQKLIDAAPLMGGARRKHAGHAIDQTSKIFNDGYKEISKGSGVKFVDESNGVFGIGSGLVAREFCRTWTKDDPYWKMDNLQKHKGNHLGKAGSVLTNTFNLNIAPIFGVNVDTEKTEKNVSKYMFSIENLAWRGTSELLGLPKSEKGPNGGRVMWFPPYDLQVGDTNSTQWNSVNFLGRPEPIYTYNYTERIGTLSWKIVVDHPSILNVITENTLKGVPDYVADQALEAFFAGCKEYDVYELASIFPNLSVDDIISIQNDITNEYNADTNTTVSDNTSGVNTPINPNPPNEGVIDLDGSDPANEGIINLDSSSTVGSESTIPDNVQGTEMEGSWNAYGVFMPGEIPTDEVQATANNQAGAGKQKKLDTAKILAKMLGEENYFNALKQDDEFIYNSLKRELKHFHPSFHSMTPEGLNNRLSFLLQCTRPGNTIPTVNSDGSLDTERDVDNTAFGAPPICVLRIGDFYHTKIAIDSVSFNYDPLIYDLNPEGIGIQPMIANVSLNFKYIGGQGLEAPVSELQNALSNNFFANTEMYNNNSVKTTTDKQKPVTDEQEIIAEMETQQANAAQGNSNGNTTEGGSTDGEQSGNLWQNFWGTGP